MVYRVNGLFIADGVQLHRVKNKQLSFERFDGHGVYKNKTFGMRIFISLTLMVAFSISLSSQEIIKGKEADISITPILHSSMVIEWDGLTIFVDPYGGAGRWAPYEPADIILITHEHGDHFDPETLFKLNFEKARIIAPAVVMGKLDTLKHLEKELLANGESTKVDRISISAVPMYNIPEATARHKKGVGNGYILTIDGKRIYISGDTGGTPEMKKLKNIDVAFICMNLPYTMSVEEAARAVLAFKPSIVYPFHYRQPEGYANIKEFKKLVQAANPKIAVRLRNWYPSKPE